MSGRFNNHGVPEALVLGARTTASFTPLAIGDTQYVSLQIVKVTGAYDGGAGASSTVNTIKLYGCNFDDPLATQRWPSGSKNEPYYALLTGSELDAATAGACSQAPLTSGSLGSHMLNIGNVNGRWLRVQLLSNTGGTFRLIAAGKGD